MDKFTYKTISVNQLLPSYKPDEVLGYCKKCSRFGYYWSCPPHSFNGNEYLAQVKNITIIGYKIDLTGFNNKEDALQYYYKKRFQLNDRLLQWERKAGNIKILFAGHCEYCKSCTKKQSQVCIHPEKMRYSLESLGYKVSDICENILNEKLYWGKDKFPNYLMTIPAILTNDEITEGLERIKECCKKQ